MSDNKTANHEHHNHEHGEHEASRKVNVSAETKNVQMRESKFHFKKDKLGNKRPTVELRIPCPTVDGIIGIIEGGGKELELLLDTVADVIMQQARSQVNDNESISQETLKLEELTWAHIANIAPAERKGGGISKETWEAFVEDYTSVMPAVTGKSAEQIGNAAKLLSGKMQACKTAKPVISFLKEQLALWYSSSPNAEDLTECYEFLTNKADTLLKADEASLLQNL
jgi:hypothetical protein